MSSTMTDQIVMVYYQKVNGFKSTEIPWLEYYVSCL